MFHGGTIVESGRYKTVPPDRRAQGLVPRLFWLRLEGKEEGKKFLLRVLVVKIRRAEAPPTLRTSGQGSAG
jgi:hypothetical protein